VRVVIADDETLLREGLVRLLEESGNDVVGTAATAVELHKVVDDTAPDVVLVDIRMPPTHTDEGLVAAGEIRRRSPATGVLVLSHFVESRYAVRLLEDHPGGTGYLLKDRVSDVAVLVDALQRVRDGECVLDPTIVTRLLSRRTSHEPVAELSERELEVLALMAEGRSNSAIAVQLSLSPKTVEAHVKHIFTKLGLAESPDDHRRVLAVLAFLRRG
jgi:DNA-binding NarL/FixJ family response regulator